MKIIRTLEELKLFVSKKKQIGKTIGFVPTMGFLHAGHISLVNSSKNSTDLTIASIYVNPSQFNESSDFINYPKDEKKDLKLLQESNCDAVFIPLQYEIESIQKLSIDLGALSHIMEGRFRPGHFKGVVEVVSRFFMVVNPDKAFFGEKDFQQLFLIKKMVADFNFPIEIVGCPIIRESNGLAMSSRNSRLSLQGRKKAGFIFELLNIFTESKRNFIENKLFELNFELEYLEKHDFGGEQRLFIAVNYDKVRLIDNIKIN